MTPWGEKRKIVRWNRESKLKRKGKNTWWFTQKSKWQGIGHRHLTVLLYHHQQRHAPLPEGKTPRGWKEREIKNKMSEDLPNTNKYPRTGVFSFGSCSECEAINSTSLGFVWNGTIARLSLLSYCLSGSRRGQAEVVVSRRRRDNLMDVCWYLDH